MEPEIPDYETAVGALACCMIEHLFQAEVIATVGEELMSLPKVDALLVMLNIAHYGISSEAFQELERQILEHVSRRRHRKLRKVMKGSYGISDLPF